MFEYAEETLASLADLLKAPAPNGTRLAGVTAPGRIHDLFAIDNKQNIYVLLEDSGPDRVLRTRRFSSISTHKSQRFRLDIPGDQVEKNFTAIVLSSSRHDLISSFSILTTALLAQLPLRPTGKEIDTFLDTFVELFKDERAINPNNVKGVWGELWFMSRALNPGSILSAWHDIAYGHFDFSANAHHVEVKTHEGERSKHHFSQGQLTIARRATSVVSCLVYADNGGQTVADLVDQLAQGMTPEQRTSLIRKTFQSLGSALEDASEYRYSVRNAEFNMVLAASEMPTVEADAGAPVTDISYVVDMTELLATRGMRLELAHSYLGASD